MIRVSRSFVVLALTASLAGGVALAGGSPVVVPDGSVDALAAAIAEAGPGGKVLLETGTHTESSTVFVEDSVTVLGEPGAVLISGAVGAAEIVPAFHVRGAAHVKISGLDLHASALGLNAAFAVQEGDHAEIANNTISGFLFGVLAYRGHEVEIGHNTMTMLDSQLPLPSHGIVAISGEETEIEGNTISNAIFGIWLSDVGGKASKNVVSGSMIGILLCYVQPGSFPIGGELVGSNEPATGWKVDKIVSFLNSWGYLASDGSHHNRLVSNAASDNALYDIELAGDTWRFGFFSPSSHDNTVRVGKYKDLVIKDCGQNNDVDAETVDTTLDPCF